MCTHSGPWTPPGLSAGLASGRILRGPGTPDRACGSRGPGAEVVPGIKSQGGALSPVSGRGGKRGNRVGLGPGPQPWLCEGCLGVVVAPPGRLHEVLMVGVQPWQVAPVCRFSHWEVGRAGVPWAHFSSVRGRQERKGQTPVPRRQSLGTRRGIRSLWACLWLVAVLRNPLAVLKPRKEDTLWHL